MKCERCPTGTLRKISGRFGIFYGCNKYPVCTFTKNKLSDKPRKYRSKIGGRRIASSDEFSQQLYRVDQRNRDIKRWKKLQKKKKRKSNSGKRSKKNKHKYKKPIT